MAKKKETGTALVKWEEKFAKLAKESVKNVKISEGKFISFGGGRMSFAGADVPDDEIRCVIVGWIYHNTYYDPRERYDPKNPQSPICYAFDSDEDTMAPQDNVPDKQHHDCASCPFNQFESAKTGRGKACKNTVRLALIAEDDLEDIDNAEVVYASIPPKSLKNWLVYLKKELSDRAKRPYWSVITLMKRIPDDDSQFKITFKNDDLIEDSSYFEPLEKLSDNTMDGIDFPYQVREAPAPSRGKGKQAPKKFGKR